MIKLNKDKFQKALGTWWPKIESFFNGGGFDEIYSVLKKESGKGIKIVPNSEDTFKCFRSTPLDELRVVIMGFCPYHSVINGICVADGLMSSCSKTGILQPSLSSIYDAIEEEYNNGLCLSCERNPDLSFLAEQGVLLTNSALTTHAEKPGMHQDLWEPFTSHILEHAIILTGVPVLLLGREAREFAGLFPHNYPLFQLTHPASVCYGPKGRKWSSNGVFKKMTDIVEGANGVTIDWMRPMDDEPPF